MVLVTKRKVTQRHLKVGVGENVGGDPELDQRLKRSTPITVVTLQDAGNVLRGNLPYSKITKDQIGWKYRQGTTIGTGIGTADVLTLAMWNVEALLVKP